MGSQPWNSSQLLAEGFSWTPPSKGPFGRERTCYPWTKSKMFRLLSLMLPLLSHSWIRPSQAEGRREGQTCERGAPGDSSLFVTLDKCHGAASVK